MKKVGRKVERKVERKAKSVPKNIKDELAIFTGENEENMWALGKPDKKGNLRTIEFNGKEKGQGVLLGSIEEVPGGYKVLSPYIKLRYQAGIEFPGRSKPIVLMSNPITTIYRVFREKVAAK